MKTLTLILVSLLFGVAPKAAAINVYLYVGGPSYSIPIPADTDNCNGNYCKKCQVRNYYARYNSIEYGTFDFSPSSTGTFIVDVGYEEDGYDLDCTRDHLEFNITDTYIIQVFNFSWKSSLPINPCFGASAFDLSSYLNNSVAPGSLDATYSGVGVSGKLFSPSLAGVGSFSVTATKNFSNGRASVSTMINVHRPSFTFNNPGSVCVDNGLVDVRNFVSVPIFSLSGVGVSGYLFNPSLAGTGAHPLTAVYTDPYGCSVTNTASITVTNTFSISAGASYFLCNDANPIPLVGEPSGGSWAGDGVASELFYPSNTTAGVHSLSYTVSVNGCTKTAVKPVTVYPLPAVEAGVNLTHCQLMGGVELNTAGVTPTDGVWSSTSLPANGAITSHSLDVSLLAPATYTLKLFKRSAQGCENFDTRTVTVLESPNIIFTNTSLALCFNSNANGYDLMGEVNPKTGTWTGGTFIVDNKFFPGVAGLGTFDLTYTVTLPNGCPQAKTYPVTVKNALLGSLTLGGEVTICKNAPKLDLSGYPNEPNGLWDGSGVVNGFFYPDVAGIGRHALTYTVNSGGCDLQATKYITVSNIPDIPIITGKTSTCKDEITTLSIESPKVDEIYQWLSDDGTELSTLTEFQFTVSRSQTIRVAAEKLNGCKSSDYGMMVLTIPTPQGDISPSLLQVKQGEAIRFIYTAADAVSYSWNLGDGTVTADLNPYHYYYALGLKDITLTFTNAVGCSLIIAKPALVNVVPSTTAVEENGYSPVQLFPSPFTRSFTVRLTEGIDRVQVFSVLGLCVFDAAYGHEERVTIADLNLSEGVYFIRVNGRHTVKTFKQ